MRNIRTLVAAAIMACAAASSAQTSVKINYKNVKRQAQKEYLRPLRAGTDGKHPFWNAYAKKFLYAPAFDFPEAPGAKGYRFILRNEEGQEWSFRAVTPKASLAPVWNKLPSGNYSLDVLSLDATGQQAMDTVGRRKFLRDFPFRGPYNTPARPYWEAALRGLYYVHCLKHIQHWREHAEPDMSYAYYDYPCKMISSVITCEVLLARMLPEYKEEAAQIASNAAHFLMSISKQPGEVLAYFPPTYRGDFCASGSPENKNKTMGMEPARMGEAMLDLYDLTSDRQYLEWALGIAQTYKELQDADGAIPIKLDLVTGQPYNESKAMLNDILHFFHRLNQSYGVTDFEEARQKGERWMQEVAVRSFDLTGQFEDVTVDVAPYSNLTNCTASTYASYLLNKKDMTKQEFLDALDLIALSEDQFTHWEALTWPSGYPRQNTPCVFEQFRYQTAVDNSAVNVATGFLDLYHRTADRLALAKCLALANQITIMQDPITGRIPTIWTPNPSHIHSSNDWWLNCHLSSCQLLLRLAEEMK